MNDWHVNNAERIFTNGSFWVLIFKCLIFSHNRRFIFKNKANFVKLYTIVLFQLYFRFKKFKKYKTSPNNTPIANIKA